MLGAAVDRLTAAGCTSARADAVALAAHVLGLHAGELVAVELRGGSIGAQAADRLERLVDERARRVPLQHLTGTAGFRGLELFVGPGVFVPRPETELVTGAAVEAALAAGPRPLVVDLCTGSGAIAAAVAHEVPGALVHAVEIDPQAHAWAARNLAGSGVRLHLADATDAAAEPAGMDRRVDVVVSNPPYVPDGMEPIDPEVADHDPAVALYGGPDGLGLPRRVAARAAVLLRPGGTFVMEHAHGQQPRLVRALAGAGWADVAGHADLAGRERFVVATAPVDVVRRRV